MPSTKGTCCKLMAKQENQFGTAVRPLILGIS